MGETRLTIGELTWKTLDRQTVGRLSGIRFNELWGCGRGESSRRVLATP